MCHGLDPGRWPSELDTEPDSDDAMPPFLNEETDAEVDLITDGGSE